jgi:two-component system chemotaxis response regulator CheY
MFEALHIIGRLKKTGCLRVGAPPVSGFVLVRNGLVVCAYTLSTVSQMLELGQGVPRADKDDWIKHQILLALNEFSNLTEGEFYFFQESVLKAPELSSVNLSNIVLDRGLEPDQIALILAQQRHETQHAASKPERLPNDPPLQAPARHSVFSTPSPPAEPYSTTVLFVDDEASMREIVSATLRRAGYNVRAASSSAEAIDIASELVRSQNAHFIVIVDLGMPTTMKRSVRGGLELVQSLQERGIDVPVLLTTEKLSHESRDDAKRLGVRKIILKPSLSKLDPKQFQSDLRSFASVIVRLLNEMNPQAAKTRYKGVADGNGLRARHILTSMGEQLTDPERSIKIAKHVLPVAATVAPRDNGHRDILEEGTSFRPAENAHLRKHERIGSLKVEARFIRGNDIGEGYLTDLSETGAFLETSQLFPVGDCIKLHIILPYQLGEVSTEARIVWHSHQDSNDDTSPHGMGLAFVGPFV